MDLGRSVLEGIFCLFIAGLGLREIAPDKVRLRGIQFSRLVVFGVQVHIWQFWRGLLGIVGSPLPLLDAASFMQRALEEGVFERIFWPKNQEIVCSGLLHEFSVAMQTQSLLKEDACITRQTTYA